MTQLAITSFVFAFLIALRAGAAYQSRKKKP